MIHLICGSTGAGKTTYSLALAKELGAVRFTLDEWMAALFWMDLPPGSDTTWAFERVDRCRDQIWSVVRQLSGYGISSVLDFGFIRRRDRTAIADLAAAESLAVRLHHLDIPREVRWERVKTRNGTKGETFQFAILRDRFDLTEALWEPPSQTELEALNGTKVFES